VLLGFQRYFPAYLPGLLIVIKWTVLHVFDRYTMANTIVDVPFASVSFAVWVITRQQPQSRTPGDDDDRTPERIFGTVSLLVNTVLYFVGVWAWMVSRDALITRFLVTGLAIILFFLVPCILLTQPTYQGMQSGGR
jgi:hypothetical protein